MNAEATAQPTLFFFFCSASPARDKTQPPPHVLRPGVPPSPGGRVPPRRPGARARVCARGELGGEAVLPHWRRQRPKWQLVSTWGQGMGGREAVRCAKTNFSRRRRAPRLASAGVVVDRGLGALHFQPPARCPHRLWFEEARVVGRLSVRRGVRVRNKTGRTPLQLRFFDDLSPFLPTRSAPLAVWLWPLPLW